MKNMKVSAKLISGFLILSITTFLVGAVGFFGISQLKKANEDMFNNNLVAIAALGDIREAYQNHRTVLRDVILAAPGASSDVEAVIKNFDVAEQNMAAGIAEYESTILDMSDEADYLMAKETFLNGYMEAKNLIAKASLDGNQAEAQKLLKDAAPTVAPIMQGLSAATRQNESVAHEANLANDALASSLILIQSIFILSGIAAAVFLGIYISSLIAKPMRFLSGYASEVAKTGDLSLLKKNHKEAERYAGQKDEIGATVVAINELLLLMQSQGEMLERISHKDLSQIVTPTSSECTVDLIAIKMLDELNSVLSGIQLSAGQVASGSRQMSDGAQSLAQGATEQASTVEELSASIAEIAEKTKNNAMLAANAAELGLSIKAKAESGSVRMNEMLEAVKEISEASRSISDVIKVIDEIAFQTNILALNAAVEAARAGVHGKGFAVVADEVRNLAAKSAEAAKTTGGMIAASIEKAQSGVKIAEETAQSLVEIVDGIDQRGKIVTQIATDSEAQAIAIEQVNEGIGQVAQVVQQNSATSEESAAVSEEMEAQAQMLEQLVSQFVLRQGASSFPKLEASRNPVLFVGDNEDANGTFSDVVVNPIKW